MLPKFFKGKSKHSAEAWDGSFSQGDLCPLLERSGFTRKEGKENHTIFFKPEVEEIITS